MARRKKRFVRNDVFRGKWDLHLLRWMFLTKISEETLRTLGEETVRAALEKHYDPGHLVPCGLRWCFHPECISHDCRERGFLLKEEPRTTCFPPAFGRPSFRITTFPNLKYASVRIRGERAHSHNPVVVVYRLPSTMRKRMATG